MLYVHCARAFTPLNTQRHGTSYQLADGVGGRTGQCSGQRQRERGDTGRKREMEKGLDDQPPSPKMGYLPLPTLCTMNPGFDRVWLLWIFLWSVGKPHGTRVESLSRSRLFSRISPWATVSNYKPRSARAGFRARTRRKMPRGVSWISGYYRCRGGSPLAMFFLLLPFCAGLTLSTAYDELTRDGTSQKCFFSTQDEITRDGTLKVTRRFKT